MVTEQTWEGKPLTALTRHCRLAHGVGVWESQHELPVVLVGAVADHVVLGSAVDITQAFLQDEIGRASCRERV